MIVKTKNDMKLVQHLFKPLQNKLLNKESAAENHFEQLLRKSGLYYRREKGNYKYNTRWSYFDFYLPYFNLYVEIDGDSHLDLEQKAIDKIKERIVSNKMKFIVRLTNEEVLFMDAVDSDFLLNRYYQQRAAKRRKGGVEHSRNRYLAVMKRKRSDGILDMTKTANFDIDPNQEIWLYDNAIGNYFCFSDIFEAKFTVELSVNEIHDLCEQSEYKRSATRRFVFAYTLKDCELRVMQTYGL